MKALNHEKEPEYRFQVTRIDLSPAQKITVTKIYYPKLTVARRYKMSFKHQNLRESRISSFLFVLPPQ